MQRHSLLHPHVKLSQHALKDWWHICDVSGRIGYMELDNSDGIEHLLDKQDVVLKLLAKLRFKMHPTVDNVVQPPNQRRHYRRWNAPESISISVYEDGWNAMHVIDVGIGGVKVSRDAKTPSSGPFVCQLAVGGLKNVLVLADIMWMSDSSVGIRFEFDNQHEHDLWAENLVDALLSKLSI